MLSKQGLLCGQRMGKLDFYEHCVFVKQCRVSFSMDVHRTKGTLDYIDSDIWCPSPVLFKGETRFLLILIDDDSRKAWVYPLKHKSDVFATFSERLS